MTWIDTPEEIALRRALKAAAVGVTPHPTALARIRALFSKKPAAFTPPRAEDPHPLKGTES